MAIIQKEFTDNWAYDLSLNLKNKGEIHNENVINQSIELILSTVYGERFFNPSFGSTLPYRLFDTIDKNFGEKILDDIAGAIKRWEDRIIVLENKMKMVINTDNHTVNIDIPYIVKFNGKSSVFKKKIII